MDFSTRNRWIYFAPATHLSLCLISLAGYLVPKLQFLGVVWTCIMFFDLPISLVALGLAWKHGSTAVVWTVVVGTSWWYFLSCGARIVLCRLKARTNASSDRFGAL